MEVTMATRSISKKALSREHPDNDELLYDEEALDVCPLKEKDCDNCDILSCPEEK